MTNENKPIFSSPMGSWRNDENAPNIFVFISWMATYVASKWGGKNSDHLEMCGSMVELTHGRRISVSERLPEEYGWTPMDAIELAKEAMNDG